MKKKGVLNGEKRHNEEFANWFAEHVRKLKNAPKPLQDISKWPGCVVYRMAACSVNGALFRNVEADKNKKTENSGVMLKVCMNNSEEGEIYGVLKEVFEFRNDGE